MNRKLLLYSLYSAPRLPNYNLSGIQKLQSGFSPMTTVSSSQEQLTNQSLAGNHLPGQIPPGPSPPTVVAKNTSLYSTEVNRSRVSQHRANRSRQEVRQQDDRVHPVHVQYKTSCEDSSSTAQWSRSKIASRAVKPMCPVEPKGHQQLHLLTVVTDEWKQCGWLSFPGESWPTETTAPSYTDTFLWFIWKSSTSPSRCYTNLHLHTIWTHYPWTPPPRETLANKG